MIKTGQCPKCRSPKIAGPHRIQGQYHIRVDLPGVLTATLESFTCTECGYSELYCDKQGLENVRKVGRFVSTSEDINQSHCPYCGTLIRHGSTFCSECGNTI
ncbi:hypothetical protein EU527_05990 [Candidatus Thorarchaeota archaeon]|nr:MAG: hypothetical protein EU527_05990 [Candidatus Thorarchaeota archaeon]